MDLWRLRIFRKVIEHKSFSKAALAINLSQPTVSSHIKDLEEHYGCRLIDRVDRKAVPTRAGQLLYKYAKRLAQLVEEMETAMAGFQGDIKGQLVVGGSTIPAGYLLPRLVGAFRERYPDVRIALRVGDTEKIINDILSGALELGVVGAASNHKQIAQKIVMEEEMRVIVPGGHKWARKKSVSLEALSKEPFIAREKGSGTLMSLQKNLAEGGLTGNDVTGEALNIVAELGSTTSVIQGIKNGLGLSVLSPVAVAEDLAAGRLAALRIKSISLKRAFYLTRHKDRTLSPLGEAFCDFLNKDAVFSTANDTSRK